MTFTKKTLPLLAIAGLVSCQSLSDLRTGSSRIITSSVQDASPVKIVKRSGPDLLTYNELRSLAENPIPTGALADKYNKLLTTPFIDNSAYFRSGMPEASIHPTLGKSLRVSTWNIEKSIMAYEAAQIMTSETQFVKDMKDEVREVPKAHSEAVRQRAALAASDVLLLQEMDIGHCRSGYLFAAEHIAKKMKMNFMYAPQQLEIDPVHLGLDHIKFGNGDVDTEACRAIVGNPKVYRGVFGVAVLSRYPIKNVELFQLKTQPYDWYEGEIKKPDFLEIGRRKGSAALFKFQPIREVKVGGRAFTKVDLHVPGVPFETVSIINIHLEIKADPKDRQKQVEEILGYIKDIKNPVVMAGDYNSSSTDVRSTSVARFSKNTVTDPTKLLGIGLFAANVTGVNQLRGIINGYKNFKNPLAWSIPVILPNKTKGLFSAVENFRFSDGGAFDFRGDKSRSTHGKSGKLSNSNQRQGKGFTFSYSVPRSIGAIGCERLDWMFVKSFLTSSNQKNGSYRLAPHFGETLGLINLSVKDAYSDHHPITTVLPLEEPKPLSL
ncbi:endonuclease/exonuclease/phosphatase family protein [Akkermansiaceae bacterium]|nr:endonuclease/exonuclease/phosphatase family protein [Akkermansiaceae bacterium]